MTAKEMRQRRAKLVEDARALSRKNGTAAVVDLMLTEAENLKARINTTERADTLFAELSHDIGRRSVDIGAGFVTDAAREQRVFASIVAGEGGALSDADKSYFADTIARDNRILAAITSDSVGRLSAEDQGHHARNYKEPGAGIRAAGNEATASAGGYTVAPLFEAELLIAMKAFGGMRSVARTIQTPTGAALPWPTMDDTGNVATIIGTENTQLTADTDLAFGQANIGAWTYKAGPLPVSLELIQDTAFDFESLVRTSMVTRFARGQNTHFTVGTGTNQPSGVVTGAALGKVGATGQTTSITYADFLDLEHSVDPAYRGKARWMWRDDIVKSLMKLADSNGRPLWQAGVADGEPDTFLGYEYTVNQDLPLMVANAKSILFGDFSNYVIRDTLGLRVMVLRERFADYLQVAWMAYARTDGKLISAASPVRYYQNSSI
ncbi:MAG TPA: phage major capsid protein [Acetobacteraceae bacterium]|jgi:HK97 family phage major capsid protein|nr:phage major capsid protein [Acetobacteraceae bacterium]